MADPGRRRWLDPGLQSDQLVAQRCQPPGERSALRPQPHDQVVPALGADRIDEPRVHRNVIVGELHPMQRCDDRTDQLRIQHRIGLAQVDPLVDPDIVTVDSGEHRSIGGPSHLWRGYAGGVSRLVERRRQQYLVGRLRLERDLHRPPAVGGVEPPHSALLATGHRPVRQRWGVAELEAVGDLRGAHRVTPAQP